MSAPAPEPDPAARVVPVRVTTLRTDPPGAVERDDAVVAEAPLELRFAGVPGTVLLRTPGHDDELVRGFLWTEGFVRSPADVVRVERPAGLTADEVGHVVDVTLFPSPDAPPLDRPLYASSSCGACGKRSLGSLRVPAQACRSTTTVARDVLVALPDRMRREQAAFDATGGVHACALFTPDGRLVALREDVGRHNALDKLVGYAMEAGLAPLDGHVVLLSGRVSFDLVQKAAVAGVPVVAAVGAPSSLAVSLADRLGLTLVGFVRRTSMNVYTHPQRVR